MTEPTDKVLPRTDAEAAADASPSAVATTAARALVLGAALTTPATLLGMEEDIVQLGFQQLPKHWGSWPNRAQILDASDDILERFEVLEVVREREEGRWVAQGDQQVAPERSGRVELWAEVAAEGDQPAAVAWLRMIMTDREPITAVAATSALSTWRRSKDIPVPAPLERASEILPSYLGSSSRAAQEIARAALRLEDPLSVQVPTIRTEPPNSASTMIHGTSAYAGTWWYTGGDFHTYVLQEVRSDLLSGGRAFSWSGAYKKRHRETAARRLAEWAGDVAQGSLNTVFAHSYGGIIALNATTHGLVVNDLVLLSAPAESVRVEWRNIQRAVSLRIHMDLVLLAARRKQYFLDNVEEHHLSRWFWNHGDSHDPTIWKDEDCATTMGLRNIGQ